MWKLTLSKKLPLEILEKILLTVFIFTIPFNTRKFIYSELKGNDFFTIFIYLSDILLLLIFALRIWRSDLVKLKFDGIVFLVLGFLIVTFFSLLIHYNFLSFYYFFKIFFGILLFFYIYFYFEKDWGSFLLRIFIFSAVLQSLIAIGQFFFQSDFGLKILGEPQLAPDVAGVAKINIDSGKFIRAYGTLVHPNVLGAFLIASIAALLYKMFFLKKNKIDYLFLTFIIGALFFSFSRAAYLAFFIFNFLFLFYIIKFYRVWLKKNYFYIPVILVVIFLLILFFEPFFIDRFHLEKDDSLRWRSFYSRIAVNMIKNNFLFGVGPGNFVKELNNYTDKPLKNFWEFQPVHNVFLLITAENGLLALVFFLVFFFYCIFHLLKSAIKNKDLTAAFLFCLLMSFFILMLFDHYFWSIWQGFLLLCITLGITCRYLFYSKQNNVNFQSPNLIRT